MRKGKGGGGKRGVPFVETERGGRTRSRLHRRKKAAHVEIGRTQLLREGKEGEASCRICALRGKGKGLGNRQLQRLSKKSVVTPPYSIPFPGGKKKKKNKNMLTKEGGK